MNTKTTKRASIPVIGVALLAVLTGCSGAGLAQATATPPRSAPSDGVNNDIREAQSPYPGFDQGHTVHITTAGILPGSLVLFCCSPVIFKNRTAVPVTVTLDISKVTSGPIAPGGTWQWTPPNPESITFHLDNDMTRRAHIQIESPNW